MMTRTPEQRFVALPRIVQATLLRIGRRIEEGFEGEVQLHITHGGVRFIRWTQTETGDSIKEELG